MKRKVISVIMVLAILLGLSVPVFATDAQLGYVTDAAGILTDVQCKALEAEAERISLASDCGVYIVVVEDFTQYAESDDIFEAAQEMYVAYGLGMGKDDDGILLLMSMAERDFCICCYGDFSNTTFTDYGKMVLEESFLDDFREDDWMGGFVSYLAKCEELLGLSEAGTPLDVPKSERKITLGGVLLIVLISCGGAGIFCVIQLSKMKQAKEKKTAEEYVTPGGVTFHQRTDLFTHVTQSRRKIETSSASRGGTSVNSSGFSGRSGKF